MTGCHALHHNAAVRRSVFILVVLAFAAIGTGALSRLHQSAHERADRQARESTTAHRHAHCHHRHHHHHDESEAPLRHDESNCVVHAMLGAPLLHATLTPPLHLCGVFVEHVELPRASLTGRPAELPVSCRGPPSPPLPNTLA